MLEVDEDGDDLEIEFEKQEEWCAPETMPWDLLTFAKFAPSTWLTQRIFKLIAMILNKDEGYNVSSSIIVSVHVSKSFAKGNIQTQNH